MSAIAGVFHHNGGPVNLQYGEILMKCLEKFPADCIRSWHDESIFFGCSAQWITPESLSEQLPYYDYERQLAITADAIIDNRRELLDSLNINKKDRNILSDSQVILLSYQKWGEDTPKYLVGDFAFMIWDQKQQKLFGARDFSGSRTLYYHKGHEKITFCTIIEPLLKLPYIEKRLNEQWLAEYLAISGMVDALDASLTPYKNVMQIPPSHSITIKNSKVNLKRYSYIVQGKRLKLKSNEEYIDAFQSVFAEAVNCRLRTHKKIGAQLSGGLDSGAVVAFASKRPQMKNNPIHTFSLIPPDDFNDFTPKYLLADERPYIKSTVNFVGGIIDHYYDFEGRDSYSEIDDFLQIMEMPYKFFENSFWLKGMFEKAGEKNVGLLLNGDRGNFSISWGFSLGYYAILLKRLKWIRLYHELIQHRNITGGSRLKKLRSITKIGFPILDQIFPKSTPDVTPSLINPQFAKKTDVYTKFREYGMDRTGWYTNTDMFDERKKHFEDIFQWNAGNTLAAKLSLRYSLWKRDPTNDLRVIRFCLSLPEDQYVQNGMDRALVRRATKGYLPDKVRLNQRIRGVQGVDWVHRIVPQWGTLLDELKLMSKDERVLEFMDGPTIKEADSKVDGEADPKLAIDPDFKFLMRCLIVYRFLKNFN